jgi:hypothetical protein
VSQTSTYPVHAHSKKKNTVMSPLMPAESDVYLMGPWT